MIAFLICLLFRHDIDLSTTIKTQVHDPDFDENWTEYHAYCNRCKKFQKIKGQYL